MKAYIAMLPILQAQEDLRETNVIAYGTANMKRQDGRAWANERRRMATSLRRRNRRAITDLPPEQMEARLAVLGIAVEFVPAEDPA